MSMIRRKIEVYLPWQALISGRYSRMVCYRWNRSKISFISIAAMSGVWKIYVKYLLNSRIFLNSNTTEFMSLCKLIVKTSTISTKFWITSSDSQIFPWSPQSPHLHKGILKWTHQPEHGNSVRMVINYYTIDILVI